MWGERFAIVWGGKWKNEKINYKIFIVAFGGLKMMNLHTTTNQKQAAVTEGTTEGRHDKQKMPGKRVIIVFGGGKVKWM